MKKIISALLVFVLLLCSISAFTSCELGEQTTPNNNAQTTSAGNNSNQAQENVSQNLTDRELLLLSGHPTFWSDLSEAETFWAHINDNKIGMDGESYKKTNIININSVKNKRIEELEVYLCNSTELNNLTIQDALPIIKSYLPISTMNGHYDCKESFIARPKDEYDKGTYYFVCYSIKNELDEYTVYFYNAFIEIKVIENHVQYFRIVSGSKPNWALNLEFNGYEKIDWNYDFLS